MYNNGIQDYRKTSVVTADPKRLVLICYEGAIENLKIAKNRYVEKDYEGKCIAVKKAQDIIDELLCSLDFEKGGAIARNLESLYRYMLGRILQGDVNKDVSALDEVIGILNELKSAWEEIFSKQDKKIEPHLTEYNEQRKQAAGYVSV